MNQTNGYNRNMPTVFKAYTKALVHIPTL